MIIKGLRQQRHWSQEQLAVFSGLSLRTIQRIEGGKRLSFESLQGPAAAFEIEVAELLRELAMKKTSSAWKKRPLWVRALYLGSGRVKMDRREFQKVEVFAAIAGFIFVVFGGCGYFGYFLAEKTGVLFLFCGALLFLGAYLMSVAARTGDEYFVWPWLDSSADNS